MFSRLSALPLVLLSACTSDRSVPPPDVACSLTREELKARREQLIPGLMARAEKSVDLETGKRLTFDYEAGLLSELAAVIDRERVCCSFLRFEITVAPDGGAITLEITGPPGTRELLRGL